MRQLLIISSLIMLTNFCFVFCLNNKQSPTADGPTGIVLGDCLTNGAKTIYSGNDNHALTVAASDISSGLQKTYNIQGAADHNHTLILTDANFTDLKANKQISLTSSDAGHTHTVVITCL